MLDINLFRVGALPRRRPSAAGPSPPPPQGSAAAAGPAAERRIEHREGAPGGHLAPPDPFPPADRLAG